MGDYTTGEPTSTSDPVSAQETRAPGAHGTNGTNGSANRLPSNGSAAAPAYASAHQPGAGHGHGPNQPNEPQADGLIQILARQWHVVVLTTITALLVGGLYLLVTHPVYTALSTMLVEPLDPSAVNGSTQSQADASDLIETQCNVIRSSAVLSLAVEKIRDLPSMRNVPRPLEYLKQNVDANLSKVGKTIDVTFDSRSQADALAVVSAVVDSYREYNSNNWSERAKSVLGILQHGQDDKQRQMSDIQARMLEIAHQVGRAPSADPNQDPAHQLVDNLLKAKNDARTESTNAHLAYQEASRPLLGDPAKIEALDKLEQNSTGASSDPQGKLKTLQDELFLEQAKLEDAERQYLPAHPIVKTIQRRIDQLTVSAAGAANEWEQSAQSREEMIDHQLDDAKKAESDLFASEQEYARLQEQLKQINDSNDEVNKKIGLIDLSKGAGALNISVLNPAEIQGKPKPLASKTLGIAMVLGLITGLAFACFRDWTDDRLRTQQAVQAVVGVPVLGSIPAISSAHTAADRGQIVHHDPFGDAAESYRTLRTALQFGLPAGTKTLLITSPVSGDGKSTLISNLGIALAQTGKKILIVDADFRAPMQHRLFGLADVIGLATVIGGTDLIEHAIQHTEIERLDLLPCGPIPSNPAEMLNDPAFLNHLNDLADKYDLILIDSPPVTAVTDARILAASVDASMLVVRPMTSTRKQTEAARDGLRGVGARLIGVAINAVPRNGSFGGASGYYPRSADFVGGGGRRPQATIPDRESNFSSEK